MNEACLIKLKSIVQDLIHKEIKSERKGRSIAFYIGLIESNFSHETLLYKIILDDAKTLIKDVENTTAGLNDSTAISGLLAMRLLKSNNQKVKKKINAYLNSRLSDFKYSPLENAMMLFLLCEGLDYLESSIRDAISNKLTDLMTTSHTLENFILIYASSLRLNKNNKSNVRKIFAKKITQYEPEKMILSERIYALWAYEIFIAPYINSFEQALKPQIERWNKGLKKQIIPQLHKELSSKPIETGMDEELINKPLSVSTFELSLIYETILKNEDKFLVISQQDFTNSLIEKSQGIFLDKIKWQNYFWVLLLTAISILPWYFFNKFNLLVTGLQIGLILTASIVFYLRYKNTKYRLLNKREWLNSNWKRLCSGILITVFGVYIVFPLGSKMQTKGVWRNLWSVLLAFGVAVFFNNILSDSIFHIKLPDKLKEGEKGEPN